MPAFPAPVWLRTACCVLPAFLARISRTRVAAELSVDVKTLYRYEYGVQCPNVYTALRLAAYYQRSVQELFPPEGGF